MQKTTPLYLAILAALALLFAVHNYSVYGEGSNVKMDSQALRGQTLWQKNNCAACHQFYGLGGYLGPDLTNVASAPGKGPKYIKAMLSAGVGAMPVFNFSPDEQASIIAFLSHVDKTGYFPNYEAPIRPDGWVQIQYKNEE